MHSHLLGHVEVDGRRVVDAGTGSGELVRSAASVVGAGELEDLEVQELAVAFEAIFRPCRF